MRLPIDLVITDIQLPDLSGFDLAAMLASTRPETPVLFISGAFTEEDFEIRAQIAQGREFLAKPFTPGVLALKVKSMLA
jgi:DNA-binding response OmpR family regulator